ncbi:MAG: TetR/AcrR family transcriptional regulator [Thermomicrobiales bacterium]
MAKVTQEHLDARRKQILDAARRAFVRDGFHATSMQDIFREADLSAGAVYRYFRSKDELIAAISEEAVADLAEGASGSLAVDPLPPFEEAFDGLFAMIEAYVARDDFGKVAVQVWAEAQRQPEIQAGAGTLMATMASAIEAYLRRYQAVGALEPSADLPALARFIIGACQGFVVQRTLTGHGDASELGAAMRALVRANPGPADGNGQA